MKLSKFTVILAVLLISILAIGAVSAESVEDSGDIAISDEISDVPEAIEPTDAAGDLGTADTADLTVDDEGGAVLGEDPVSYDLDDDSYSTYFNEDGTATEVINESSDYTLVVDTLTNKDIKILYGTNINIIGKEGSGLINNGTITIGDGLASAGSITISGLTFTNTNKDGVVVNDLTTDVTIKDNKFDLTYDDSSYNAIAIATYGYVYDIAILNNNMTMRSAATNTYGIDLMFYLPGWASHGISNAEEFLVAENTIDIVSTATSGVAEGIYLDTIANSVIENNTIKVKTTNAGVANYGMQVADSYGWTDLQATVNSPHNITIENNDVALESADMAYGITVIAICNMDLVDFDEDYVLDMNIIGNNVTITSESGAIGIGAKSQDVKITDNNVNISADVNKAAQIYADPEFGIESAAIFVNNYAGYGGPFANNTVTLNSIISNVNPIKVTRKDEDVEPLVISENTINGAYFVINDANYDIYFNEDGTVKDYLSADGNYILVIDTLTGKDIKISSGSNINITAKEDAGFINNGTIYIDGGADGLAHDIIISGLTFTNTNKGAIDIAQYCTNITIQGNAMDLIGDTSVSSVYTLTAIAPHDYINGLNIIGNYITVTGNVPYSNGIYSMNWGVAATPSNFNISQNTIVLDISSTTGSNAAIYVECSDSVIANNNILVKSVGEACAYGIQVPDSSYSMMAYGKDPTSDSPKNVSIKNNIINIETQNIAYGITLISFGLKLDEEGDVLLYDFPLDFAISDNVLTINSAKGAIAVGGIFYDGNISNNNITVIAGSSEGVVSYDMIGVGTYATYIISRASYAEDDYEVTVEDNNIITNIVPEYTDDEDFVTFDNTIVSVQDESGAFVVNETTYDIFFDGNGNLKPIPEESTLLLGDLSNKKMTINVPITINALDEDSTLINCTINLVQGADNSVIDGLTIEFTGDNTTGSIGIIYIVDVTNVTISNNKITVPDFVDKIGAKYGSSVYAIEVESGMLGCKDIFIDNNDISIEGTCRYLYGIDVFQTWGSENRNNNINIFENNVTINGGSRMAEAIYVSASDDVVIDGNIIDSTSTAAAYGVATDQLTNAMITSNKIDVDAGTMAYGITATTSGSDITIRANEVDAKGTGAVGVGVNKQDAITIEDNTVAIDGGDFTTITSSDSLGTANAAILVGEGNTNVEVSANDITEVSAVRLTTTFEVSDINVTAAPSGNGTLQFTLKTIGGGALANQVVNVVLSGQMYELTTDENGVAVLSFALNKSGTFNVNIFYLGDDNYKGSTASAKITIKKIATKTTSAAKSFLATATTKALTATLKDADGNALANKTVAFTVNGKTYKATTNANGVATVKLALTAAKTYKVSIKFAGDSVYAASTKAVNVKLNKEATKLIAPNKTFKAALKTKSVVVTLRNSKNKPIANKKVTLVVNKKKYTVKTNSKGQAIFKVALTKKGTYSYTAQFATDTQYKAAKKAGKIIVN